MTYRLFVKPCNEHDMENYRSYIWFCDNASLPTLNHMQQSGRTTRVRGMLLKGLNRNAHWVELWLWISSVCPYYLDPGWVRLVHCWQHSGIFYVNIGQANLPFKGETVISLQEMNIRSSATSSSHRIETLRKLFIAAGLMLHERSCSSLLGAFFRLQATISASACRSFVIYRDTLNNAYI